MQQEDNNGRSDIKALARQAQELGTRCVSSALGWLEDRTRQMKNRDQDQNYSRQQQPQAHRGSPGQGERYGDDDFGSEREVGQRWRTSGEYGADVEQQYGQGRQGGYRGSEYRGSDRESGESAGPARQSAQSGQSYGYNPSYGGQGQAEDPAMRGWQGQQNRFGGERQSGSQQYAAQQYGQGSQYGHNAPSHGPGPAGGGRYGWQYGQQDEYRQGRYGGHGEGPGGSGTGGRFGGGGGYAGGGGYGSQYGQGQGGCGRQPSMRGRGPKNYTRSDERITEDLNEKLSQDDYLDASEINVEVKQGVATLSGTVEQRWMKHHAEDLAESCSGIKDVENHIRVSPSATSQRSGSEMGSGLGRTSTTTGGTGGSWGTSDSDSGASTSRTERH